MYSPSPRAFRLRTPLPWYGRLAMRVERRPLATAAVALAVVAFALRVATFGDQLAGFDEQFYLLVGERMWAGALPYVDLWDRKPFGLFVAFWAFSAGGHGLIVSQIAATMSAAATAWMVVVIARRRVELAPAMLAGLLYLVSLRLLGGKSTQTPVFYNLFVAVAAWAVLGAGDRARRGDRNRRVAAAMLLCGLAIQFKPLAALDGILFGCIALLDQRRAGAAVPRLVRRALGYALLGLAPSLAAIAFYAWHGQLDAFWYANVVSIFARREVNDPSAIETMMLALGGGAPVLVFAAAGLWHRFAASDDRREAWVLLLWTLLSLAEFFMLGCYWCHYLLPFILVGSIASASCFASVRRPRLFFAIVAVAPVLLSTVWDTVESARDRRNLARMVAAMPPGIERACLFLYGGQPILYNLVNACTVTRFAFPDHLRSSREDGALGVDSAAEMRRVLARRPLAIGTVRNSTWPLRNRVNDALLADALRRDYRLRAEMPASTNPDNPETFQLWELKGDPHRKL